MSSTDHPEGPNALPGNGDACLVAPGTLLARYQMPIERGKVLEFARAIGAAHPAYTSSDTPPAPPTFLVSSKAWEPNGRPLYEILGIDLSRLLHGEQEFSFYGKPVRAGMTLTVEVRVEAVVEKRGRRGGSMRVVRIVTDYTDETESRVARLRATLIETEAKR
jgi:N-terminal half of MaoC dehydratase